MAGLSGKLFMRENGLRGKVFLKKKGKTIKWLGGSGARGIHIPHVFAIHWGAKELLRVSQPFDRQLTWVLNKNNWNFNLKQRDLNKQMRLKETHGDLHRKTWSRQKTWRLKARKHGD